jgi:hypothetical protein
MAAQLVEESPAVLPQVDNGITAQVVTGTLSVVVVEHFVLVVGVSTVFVVVATVAMVGEVEVNDELLSNSKITSGLKRESNSAAMSLPTEFCLHLRSEVAPLWPPSRVVLLTIPLPPQPVVPLPLVLQLLLTIVLLLVNGGATKLPKLTVVEQLVVAEVEQLSAERAPLLTTEVPLPTTKAPLQSIFVVSLDI